MSAVLDLKHMYPLAHPPPARTFARARGAHCCSMAHGAGSTRWRAVELREPDVRAYPLPQRTGWACVGVLLGTPALLTPLHTALARCLPLPTSVRGCARARARTHTHVHIHASAKRMCTTWLRAVLRARTCQLVLRAPTNCSLRI
ncbi:hypothetical protein EON67_06345 [archaeon]|nr:MAG: hypothetical protein EON67_06345 [archaeon]